MPYIAMRYLGGGSMADFIKHGMHDLDTLEKPIRQIAQALDYAHRQGIIHRDIKPGNIMMDEAQNAYLSDFGIARVMGSNLTGSMIVGTPAYMSPEQANGLPIDGRADIYALGVVLFELITGREPYQAETPMAVLLKHINEPMPPINTIRGDVPESVQRVVERSTAKDPNGRYASAGDMAKDFSAALRGDPLISPEAVARQGPAAAAKPLPQPVPVQAPAPTPYPAIDPATQQPTQPYPGQPSTQYPGVPASARGGIPGRLIAGILLLVIVVGGGVFAATQMGGGGGTATATPDPVLSAVPTPPTFQWTTVETDVYTISMPRTWIPSGTANQFIDESDLDRRVNIWRGPNGDTYVALELLQVDTSNADNFATAVQSYQSRYIDGNESLTLIDEQVAPDGSLRRSYRMIGATNPEFPPGQLDVFYLARQDVLAVLHVYSADSLGSNQVDNFQWILDSVRIKSS
jgi:hypothetical protein